MAENKTTAKKTTRGGGSAGSGSPMDVGLLEQIVRLMADNDLNTVDVRDGDKRVILKRGQAVVSVPGFAGYPGVPAAGLPAAPLPPAATPAGSPATGAGGGGAPSAAAGDESKLVPILSPMPGTFYAAPKPGEKPFVSVGSVVNEETEVCLIEAMKTFNTHKAGVSGTIARVLVQNGQTVQFDQPLFLVKPA